MPHDEHFLNRVQRLEREHAEIALGLYYDSDLVQHILQVSDIPEQAERVALCLGTPERGPFVIVARDGHFVTALGEGMVLKDEQPVISRHRLDQLSESLESLRELVTDAQAGGRKQTKKKLERALRAGPGLSQEEFDDLARWLPLLDVKFLLAHMDAVESSRLIIEHLSRYKKLKRRHDEALHEYWRNTWAIAHLTMLLGSDGGVRVRELLGPLESTDPGCAMQLPWCLIRLGVLSFGVRGTWIASKMPGLVVPAAKRRYVSDQTTLLSSMTDGLSLSAVGLRHRRYQGEVRKVLTRAQGSIEKDASLSEIVQSLAFAYYEQHLSDPEVYRAHTAELARKVMRELYETLPDFDLALLDDLPDQIPVASFLNVPLGFREDLHAMRCLFEHLPWVTGAEARDFYLPEPFVRSVRGPWSRDDGLALFDARTSGGLPRAQPVVAGPKIGRNARCPCGSGRKYKRCCGAPGKV